MDGEMFVSRINNLLEQHDKSKTQFYQDLGLPNNALTKWKYNSVPNAETALNVAKYLHTTVEYLLTGEESDSYKDKYDSLVASIKKILP